MKHRQAQPPGEPLGDRYGLTICSGHTRKLAERHCRPAWAGGADPPAAYCLDAPELLPAGSSYPAAPGWIPIRGRFTRRPGSEP